MRLEVHHFHRVHEGSAGLLREFFYMLGNINRRMETIMATMQDLQAAVERNTSAERSVVDLLNGISQQLKDAQAQNDPAAVQAVIDQIDANSKAMADAVTANTPAAPSVSAPQATPDTTAEPSDPSAPAA